MAKKETQVSKVTPVVGGLEKPDYLQDAEVIGLEGLKKYVILPFIKVVQKMASKELTDVFNIGDLIASGSNSLIAQMNVDTKFKSLETGNPFHFVPLFFYPEWCTWSPFEGRGQAPAIINRSLDPACDIAAKSNNPNLRAEEIDTEWGKLMCRHVEHLAYVVTLWNHPLAGTPMILSFQKGEHGTGRAFSSLIAMRKASPFACVFQGVSTYRPGSGKGDWYGIQPSNPSGEEAPEPWVPEDEMNVFKVLHLEMKKAYEEKRLIAGYDEDRPDDSSTSGDGKDDDY